MSIHKVTGVKRAEQEMLQVFQNETPSTHNKRYKINEIFYTIQGEGDQVGTAAIFIRFSVCNLACTWCDTEYDSGVMMSRAAILAVLEKLTSDRPLIVCSGGEPSLQMDDAFVDLFGEEKGYPLSMETNGIKWRRCMRGFDTITVSPKTVDGWWSNHTMVSLGVRERATVLKVVYDPGNPDMERIMKLAISTIARSHFLQPLEDQVSKETNVIEVVKIVQSDPRWRLSLQTHKILNVR